MPMQKSVASKAPAVNLAAMLTGAQIRAARALLKWSGRELSEHCGVSYAALQRAESADEMPNMHTRSLLAIKQSLEAAGVVFLDPGQTRDGGAGVRLKV
ncbi:MAG TPA: helix-turn-helix transcriptional regulator [Reyranella sp.]|jgi:transcriptional regulator with XRE-family HTH domain|nr:helix-turn-helix transcriptional regulator [Reyranella sp.]HQS15021.1 helix-turn-helix transcriptional regulator [Reyranella sp.]HQT10830.1 helix-turn-helix transcriptional regulator [Reyranella sp.]